VRNAHTYKRATLLVPFSVELVTVRHPAVQQQQHRACVYCNGCVSAYADLAGEHLRIRLYSSAEGPLVLERR
jgi:hypothetical protein